MTQLYIKWIAFAGMVALSSCASRESGEVTVTCNSILPKECKNISNEEAPPNLVRATIYGEDFEPLNLNCLSDESGDVLFEGDIVVGKVSPVHTKGIGIVGQAYRWPNGIVPYIVDSDFPDADWIREAIS